MKNKTKQKPLKSSKMGLNQRLKLGALKLKISTEGMSLTSCSICLTQPTLNKNAFQEAICTSIKENQHLLSEICLRILKLNETKKKATIFLKILWQV